MDDWIYPMGLGAVYSIANVNFDKGLKQVEDVCAKDCNALPNLERFNTLGHRLLIIQGKLDTVVPAQYAKEYYDALVSRNGGLAKTRDFARIFFVPGMWHGNQSDCDPLAYLRKWVEAKHPPESIDIGVQYRDKPLPTESGRLLIWNGMHWAEEARNHWHQMNVDPRSDNGFVPSVRFGALS